MQVWFLFSILEYGPMVRLKGPGLGTGASGSLSDALIFSSNKGRAYLKKGAKPKQPRSPSQVTLRVQMDFHSREWKSIAPAAQATWASLATQTRISPFNAFQAYNLSRARNHQRPTMAWPAADIGADSVLSGGSITPGPQCIHNQMTVDVLNFTWALYQWSVPAPATQPLWNELINIHNIYALGTYKWTVRHLTPGTYYFCWTLASIKGKHTPAPIWRTIVVPN